jgi:hypothetical protein
MGFVKKNNLIDIEKQQINEILLYEFFFNNENSSHRIDVFLRKENLF